MNRSLKKIAVRLPETIPSRKLTALTNTMNLLIKNSSQFDTETAK